MVVLDQDRIIQAEAMIGPAAASHGILFERPQARCGFAGVCDAGARPGYGVDEILGQGGDPAETAQQGHTGPLGREDCARVAADLGKRRPCRHDLAIVNQRRELHRRIELGDGQPHA